MSQPLRSRPLKSWSHSLRSGSARSLRAASCVRLIVAVLRFCSTTAAVARSSYVASRSPYWFSSFITRRIERPLSHQRQELLADSSLSGEQLRDSRVQRSALRIERRKKGDRSGAQLRRTEEGVDNLATLGLNGDDHRFRALWEHAI